MARISSVVSFCLALPFSQTTVCLSDRPSADAAGTVNPDNGRVIVIGEGSVN